MKTGKPYDPTDHIVGKDLSLTDGEFEKMMKPQPDDDISVDDLDFDAMEAKRERGRFDPAAYIVDGDGKAAGR